MEKTSVANSKAISMVVVVALWVVCGLFSAGAAARTDQIERLHKAAATGDLRTIRAILEEQPALVNATEPGSDRTALMRAATADYQPAAMIDLLAGTFGADLKATDTRGQTALMIAAARGTAETVRALVKVGAEVRAVNHQGRTALMLAASGGTADRVRALLHAGARRDARDENGWTPLMFATAAKNPQRMALLIEPAIVNAADESGRTALHLAADDNFAIGVDLLLATGADPATTDERWRTPLHLAATHSDVRILRVLLSAAADGAGEFAGARDLDGRTPLMYGAQTDDPTSVRVLLEAGASIDAADYDRRTALLHAAETGSAETLAFLIDHGADLSARDRRGRMALHIVAPRKNRLLLDALLKRAPSLDLNAANLGGVTALMLAAERGPVANVLTLLEHGADPNLTDDADRTALIYAARASRSGVRDQRERSNRPMNHRRDSDNIRKAVALIAAGADVHAADRSGDDALMHAANRGDLAMVEYLLARGASVTTNNEHGETALMLAARRLDRDAPQVVARLLGWGADIDAVDQRGWTALLHAARFGAVETLIRLLDAGAEVNHADGAGRTALILAASAGSASRVRALLDAAADPALADHDGRTAAEFARQAARRFGIDEVLQLLGADSDGGRR